MTRELSDYLQMSRGATQKITSLVAELVAYTSDLEKKLKAQQKEIETIHMLRVQTEHHAHQMEERNRAVKKANDQLHEERLAHIKTKREVTQLKNRIKDLIDDDAVAVYQATKGNAVRR